jgi:hypothetical protein
LAGRRPTPKRTGRLPGGELSVGLKSNLVYNLNLFTDPAALRAGALRRRHVATWVAARTGKISDAPSCNSTANCWLRIRGDRERVLRVMSSTARTKRALYVCSGLLLLLTYLFCRY